MERAHKLRLTNWTKANNALNLNFEGNKSRLTEHLKMSRTTVTAFFKQEPVREAEFRKICLALQLNWKVDSDVSAIAPLEQKTDWIEDVRVRCCQKILYQHSRIQLLNQTEVGVDELYVYAWVLNRSPRTFQVSESKLLESFDLRNDRLGLGDRIQRNEGMAIANDNSKLLILGKPGSGKTTFLKHLAIDCSNGKFQPDLIPVLIELRRIRSAEWQLQHAIAEVLEIDQRKTQELLEQGKLLILMDGLDEVPTDGLRQEVQAQVSQLSQEPKYSNNRLILACRTQIIGSILPGFVAVEMADFNDEQVKVFVLNWFQASGQTKATIDQRWQAFSEAMQEHPALKELTATPVLLSLICLVLQDVGELPSQIASLYRKSIRLLLEKWNDRKDIPEWEIGEEAYRQLSIEQKEALLSEIAAQKFQNPSNFWLFEQAELTQKITDFLKLDSRRDGEAVLRAIEAQHGLIVERADELWSFSHLTIQEYFMEQWLNQFQKDEGLAGKISDVRWQTVVQLAVESQQPADRLLKLIKQAIDRSVANDTKIQEFLNWVQTKVANISSKPSEIRIIYDLALLFILNRSIDQNLDQDPGLDLLANQRSLELAEALNLGDNNSDAILANELKQLRSLLPENPAQTFEEFRQWWTTNQEAWKKEIRQMMREQSDIGYNWQFTDSQKQALKHYYDANKFLVELLKIPGAVSDPVRQEIEDNLLLPIATLQQRLPDQYS